MSTSERPDSLCPVCGFDLGFKPWDGPSASDEICPCCGIQFGYDDAAGGNVNERQEIYTKWRERWINSGMQWWSKGRKPPLDWKASTQLAKISG